LINLSTHPNLTDLHDLISEVPSYPISARQLVQLALRNNYPAEVVDFYRAFSGDHVFFDQDDALGQTELIELMETDEQPFEDVSRGAED
jgi:hypothetical protein